MQFAIITQFPTSVYYFAGMDELINRIDMEWLLITVIQMDGYLGFKLAMILIVHCLSYL